MSWIAFTDDVPAVLEADQAVTVLCYFPNQTELASRGIRPVTIVRYAAGPDGETDTVYYCAATGLRINDEPTHWQPMPNAPTP